MSESERDYKDPLPVPNLPNTGLPHREKLSLRPEDLSLQLQPSVQSHSEESSTRWLARLLGEWIKGQLNHRQLWRAVFIESRRSHSPMLIIPPGLRPSNVPEKI